MERLGTILIGNKKYDNLNIDNIIDSFNMNYRFNMALPNNNNGNQRVHDNTASIASNSNQKQS